jgi:hypothetical protein
MEKLSKDSIALLRLELFLSRALTRLQEASPDFAEPTNVAIRRRRAAIYSIRDSGLPPGFLY